MSGNPEVKAVLHNADIADNTTDFLSAPIEVDYPCIMCVTVLFDTTADLQLRISDGTDTYEAKLDAETADVMGKGTFLAIPGYEYNFRQTAVGGVKVEHFVVFCVPGRQVLTL